MRDLSAIRKVDQLGRVCLPIEYRRVLDLDDNDLVEITISDDCIMIRRHISTINYEDILKRQILSQLGNAYQDVFISEKNIDDFKDLIMDFTSNLFQDRINNK